MTTIQYMDRAITRRNKAEIYFQNGPANGQTANPLDFWKNWNTFENESL